MKNVGMTLLMNLVSILFHTFVGAALLIPVKLLFGETVFYILIGVYVSVAPKYTDKFFFPKKKSRA